MVTIPTTYQSSTSTLASAAAVIEDIGGFINTVTASLNVANSFWNEASGGNLTGTPFLDIFDKLVFDGSGDNGEGFCHILRKRILKELYDLELYFVSGGSSNSPTYPSDYDLTEVKLTDDTMNEWWAAQSKFTDFKRFFTDSKAVYDSLSSLMSSSEKDDYFTSVFFDGTSSGALHQKRVEVVEAIAEVRMNDTDQ